MIRKQLYLWQCALNRMSLRERILIFITASVLIYFLGVGILGSSLYGVLTQAAQEKSQLTAEIARFTAQTEKIEKDAKTQPMRRLKSKQDQLETKIARLTQKIADHQYGTVFPKEIETVLHTILQDAEGIRIQKFEILHEGLLENTSKHKESEPTWVVPHYFEVQLLGRYFTLEAELARLENLEWKIYWDKFTYEVLTYPEAKLTLRFHLLSMNQNGDH